MKASVRFGVLEKVVVGLFVADGFVFFALFGGFVEVVAVNKVFARVVGRVYVNHFDFAKVCFLQNL